MADTARFKNTRFDYYLKAVRWFAGNFMFGIVPLLWMLFVSYLTDGKEGKIPAEHLVYEGGVIIFVLIAMMGAVLIDFLLSGIPSTGKQIFYIYMFPLIVLGIISGVFILLCVNVVDKMIFDLESWTTRIVFILSFCYCTFAKANLYLREDLL